SCSGATPTCAGTPAACTCASPNVQACGGSMCCSPPPANSNAIISCAAGTSCALQCATSYHACNGTVTPCYSDTDTQHCSNGCLDCRQPNATAACGPLNSNSCANTCLVSTLSCPGGSTKPSCGSWNFESGTNEGWSVATDFGDATGGVFGVTTEQHATGKYSLKIGHNDPDAQGTFGAYSTFQIQLCPSASAIDINNKTISVSIYTDPKPDATASGTLTLNNDCEMYVWFKDSSGALTGKGGYLDAIDGTNMLPPRMWRTLSASFVGATLPPTTAYIVIQFRTYNDNFVGNVYYDDIKIQ
ncbi:MAG TPA: hypothetical protein VHO67_09630, partial [Polyangia bacterium]|nr:hypothetical protein [Polyangia bacterium]